MIHLHTRPRPRQPPDPDRTARLRDGPRPICATPAAEFPARSADLPVEGPPGLCRSVPSPKARGHPLAQGLDLARAKSSKTRSAVQAQAGWYPAFSGQSLLWRGPNPPGQGMTDRSGTICHSGRPEWKDPKPATRANPPRCFPVVAHAKARPAPQGLSDHA